MDWLGVCVLVCVRSCVRACVRACCLRTVPVFHGNYRPRRLNGNQLTGRLPTTMAQLSLLETLDVSNNVLGGPMPSEIFVNAGAGVHLRSLIFSNNSFHGSLPACFGSLAALTTLAVANNSLTGPLPAWLGSLARLRNLCVREWAMRRQYFQKLVCNTVLGYCTRALLLRV